MEKIIQDEEILSEEFQDRVSFNYEQLHNDSILTAGLFFHKKGEVKQRVRKGGRNHHRIGLLIIVALYT